MYLCAQVKLKPILIDFQQLKGHRYKGLILNRLFRINLIFFVPSLFNIYAYEYKITTVKGYGKWRELHEVGCGQIDVYKMKEALNILLD